MLPITSNISYPRVLFLPVKTQIDAKLPERRLHGEDRTKGKIPHGLLLHHVLFDTFSEEPDVCTVRKDLIAPGFKPELPVL